MGGTLLELGEPEATWPYFAENISLIEEALGLATPPQPVSEYMARRGGARRSRSSACFRPHRRSWCRCCGISRLGRPRRIGSRPRPPSPTRPAGSIASRRRSEAARERSGRSRRSGCRASRTRASRRSFARPSRRKRTNRRRGPSSRHSRRPGNRWTRTSIRKGSSRTRSASSGRECLRLFFPAPGDLAASTLARRRRGGRPPDRGFSPRSGFQTEEPGPGSASASASDALPGGGRTILGAHVLNALGPRRHAAHSPDEADTWARQTARQTIQGTRARLRISSIRSSIAASSPSRGEARRIRRAFSRYGGLRRGRRRPACRAVPEAVVRHEGRAVQGAPRDPRLDRSPGGHAGPPFGLRAVPHGGDRQEADRQVHLLAERRGWSIDELADRTIPTAGFDGEAGCRSTSGRASSRRGSPRAWR